ncbi:MAG: helix-turn-helix domain-containing protein [Chloroflexota bacterium]
MRSLTDDERQQLEAGLRCADAFALRRCQLLLASARGQRAPASARNLGRNGQTVRNAIAAFNESGLACPRLGSTVPHTLARPLDANVGPLSIQFLEWVCERLESLGKKAFLLVWDNASWHISKQVRAWLR